MGFRGLGFRGLGSRGLRFLGGGMLPCQVGISNREESMAV